MPPLEGAPLHSSDEDGAIEMTTLAVIGLGYVGLPLVVEFGKQMRTIGFDIAQHKVDACLKGTDPSRELSDEQMALAKHAVYTSDPKMLGEADIIIVAVPTPVDEAHIPDFKPLIGSSTSAGRHMKKGAIVVYESTVYPAPPKRSASPCWSASRASSGSKTSLSATAPSASTPVTKSTR